MILPDNNLFLFPSYTDINKNNKKICKILYICSKRELYENVINDKEYIKKIKKIKKFYYLYDYPFPNVNLIFYNKINKEYWLKRIKAYYYSKNDSNWYKMIN